VWGFFLTASLLGVYAVFASGIPSLYLFAGRLCVNSPQAVAYFDKSIALHKRLSDRDVAIAQRQLGIYHLDNGDLERAQQYFNDALEVFTKMNISTKIADVHEKLATLAERQGKTEDARDSLDRAIDYFRVAKDISGQGRALVNMARLLKTKDPQKAEAKLDEALNLTSSAFGNSSYRYADVMVERARLKGEKESLGCAIAILRLEIRGRDVLQKALDLQKELEGRV
jgi:tetratricopeptide (TPR) repeat protein